MTKYTFDEEGVAFYFFISTLVGFYVIPTTLRLLWKKKVIDGGDGSEQEPKSSVKESIEKWQNLKKIEAAKHSLYIPKLLFLALLWAVLGWSLFSAWQAKINFKPYDPFDVLGVPSGSNEDVIKATFKKLSRLHHPDKAAPENRGKAEAKFVEISKAYRALTDEKARKNWEEFGNPDGIRTFALGVALPSWLVNSGNRMIVLALYCIAFGIGLPLLVRQWWSKSKKYTKDGLYHSSMTMFFHELKENSSIKRIVELLANSSEYEEELLKGPEENDDSLEKFLAILNDHMDPYGDYFELPKKITRPSSIKAYALLYAHFHQVKVEDEKLRQDQAFIISKGAQLVQGIMQIAIARQWLLPATNCALLSQYLVQGMWENQSPLLQLPFITSTMVKNFSTGKRSIKSISELLDMNESDRRALLMKVLDNDQYDQVISMAQTFPQVRVDAVSFKILGQESITPGGVITCQVRLSLEYPRVGTVEVSDNTSGGSGRGSNNSGSSKGKEKEENASTTTTTKLEDEVQTFEFDEDGNLIDEPSRKAIDSSTAVARPVYCPKFPNIKRPFWWVSLVNKNNTNFVAPPVKVFDLVDRKTVTLQFSAPPKPMNVGLLLVVKSDSIVGVDFVKEVKFTVAPQQENSPIERWDISGDEDDQKVPFADDEN